ncbi:MAG: hypothetical protein ACK4FJ_02070 [Ferrovibrio sp.]|uniref:hypothetical protein n=1 Tax=Ferrovibrio sp. TaxID=1917215 RepID=UPI003918881B
MLRKMLLQGLAAAAIIAGAAAVYAGTADDAPMPDTRMVQATPAAGTDTGYLQPQTRQTDNRREDRDGATREGHKKDRERHSERRHRDHDDD